MGTYLYIPPKESTALGFLQRTHKVIEVNEDNTTNTLMLVRESQTNDFESCAKLCRDYIKKLEG